MDNNILSILKLLFSMQKTTKSKYAYICSPLKADTRLGINLNMQAARVYMAYVMDKLGFRAKAPHAHLPEFLDDNVPAQRAAALRFGLKVLEESNVMLVCGNSLSIGMKGEIVHATKLGIPISVFSRKLYLEVCEVVKASGGDAESVMHDMLHPVLSLSARQLLDSGYIKSEGNLCYASLNG